MSRILYSLLWYVITPWLLISLLWRALHRPSYRERFTQRFAIGLPVLRPGSIWVHAVSVGEAIASADLIRQLQQRYPHKPITVTCMTPTGSAQIRTLFGTSVQHCYLPYDLPCVARCFIRRLQPSLAIIIETELWPNYLHYCAGQNIPMVLANARLSARSAKGYARFSGLTAAMLSQLRLIAVQTPLEAERFCALGAAAERVLVTGSVKYDIQPDPALLISAQTLRQEWCASTRPIWIAASTHSGEDEIVLAAHQELRAHFPDALLILVPRHPERFEQVYALCTRLAVSVQKYSLQEPLATATQVVLGDTMGTLLFLYALADIAFVGGSLVTRGGHNLLEPVVLGKPVLSGPHVFNFLEIANQLHAAGALCTVECAADLSQTLRDLLQHADKRTQMARAGQLVVANNRGALERLLAALAPLLADAH